MCVRIRVAVACLGALAACSSVRASDRAAEPMTLSVAARTDLGPVQCQGLDYGRWNRCLVAGDGRVLVLLVTDAGQVALRATADGRGFSKPLVVGNGSSPAGALDAEGNLHVAWRNAAGKISLRILPRKADGWDASAEESTPFACFGRGAEMYPSLLILPGSKRIWCLYSYQRADLGKQKPRTEPLLTFSDDGGGSWAEPQYVGSDSGDVGTGIWGLRPFRGRPAFFWAFWDCAPPAWGFFDGSRVRTLREIFPHTKLRTACWHVWDTAQTDDGRLWFATGLDYATPGQIYKTFDGSRWTGEVFLSATFGRTILATDGRRMFCLAADGGVRKTHGRRVSLYQLWPDRAAARGTLYEPAEGWGIFRVYPLPDGRGPAGWWPVFLVEQNSAEQAGEQRLICLRAEAAAIPAGHAAAPTASLVDPRQQPEPRRAQYAPMPIDDNRAEPRTDVPKDRKLLRVGSQWVLIYADDNPGRLMAAPLSNGKLGEPVALLTEPAWNRWQCAGIADGDDALVAVCAEGSCLAAVRLAGIRDWATRPPRPAVKRVLADDLTGDPRPSLCRAADGRLWVVYVNGTLRTLAFAGTDMAERVVGEAGPAVGPDPWPSLLAFGGEPVLLTGSAEGVRFDRLRGGEPTRAVGEPWIGPHFSAVSHDGRIDLVYSPAASHLGAAALRHVTFDGRTWSRPADVDTGRPVRGMSLCSLGGGRLLCAYAVQDPRRADAPAGVERLERLTYTLVWKLFDGSRWQAEPTPVGWPEVQDHRPARWDPSFVEFSEVREMKGLLETLQQQAAAQKPSPGKRILDLANAATREAILKMTIDRRPTREQSDTVMGLLGETVAAADLYDAASWAGLALAEEAARLIEQRAAAPVPDQQRRLNRLLLDAAFGRFIEPGRTWRQRSGSRGFVITFAREQGIFPTLPEAAVAADRVPAAWMVPGFACITRYWYPSDRGGMLVCGEWHAGDRSTGRP